MLWVVERCSEMRQESLRYIDVIIRITSKRYLKFKCISYLLQLLAVIEISLTTKYFLDSIILVITSSHCKICICQCSLIYHTQWWIDPKTPENREIWYSQVNLIHSSCKLLIDSNTLPTKSFTSSVRHCYASRNLLHVATVHYNIFTTALSRNQ